MNDDRVTHAYIVGDDESSPLRELFQYYHKLVSIPTNYYQTSSIILGIEGLPHTEVSLTRLERRNTI